MSSVAHHTPNFSWRVSLWVIPSVVVGLVLGQALGLGSGALYVGFVAGIVTLTGSSGSLRNAMPLAGSIGAILFLLTVLASVTANNPFAAALAMSVVAFLTSLLSSSAPVGLLLSLLGTLYYLFATIFGLALIKDQHVSVLALASASLIGVMWGLLFVAARAFLHDRRIVGQLVSSSPQAGIFKVLSVALKEFRRGPRDGIRRAIALGAATYWFEVVPSHDAVLILLTVAIVLPVDGRAPLLTVAYRLFGAFLAIGVALSTTYLIPPVGVYAIAIGACVYAITVAARSTTQTASALGIAFLLFIGAPGADIGIYAGWRLVEVAAGFAIAFAAGYALWPKQPLTVVPVAEDLVSASVTYRLP